MTIAPTILVFDSGLGGLTVLREVASARPDARYVYAADDAFFPYSGRGEAELVARVVTLVGELIDAYNHYYYHYDASPLLVVDTRHLDFATRDADLDELVHQLSRPIRGTQYWVPVGSFPAEGSR